MVNIVCHHVPSMCHVAAGTGETVWKDERKQGVSEKDNFRHLIPIQHYAVHANPLIL
jgi:hypothetical protein